MCVLDEFGELGVVSWSCLDGLQAIDRPQNMR